MTKRRTVTAMGCFASLAILHLAGFGHAQGDQIDRLSQFVMVDYRQGAGTNAGLVEHHRDFLLARYLGQDDPNGHPMTPQRLVLYVTHPGVSGAFSHFYDPRDTVPTTGPCAIDAPGDAYRFVDFLEAVGKQHPDLEIELFVSNGSVAIDPGDHPVTNSTWQCPPVPATDLPTTLAGALANSGKFVAAPEFMQWVDALNTTMDARGSAASPAFENPIKGVTFDPEGMTVEDVIATSLAFDNLMTRTPGLQHLRLGTMPGYGEIKTAKALTTDFPASSWPADLACATIGAGSGNWTLFNSLLTSGGQGRPTWRSGSDTSSILDSAYIQVYNDCGTDPGTGDPRGPVAGSLYLWQNQAACGDRNDRAPRTPEEASTNLLNTLRNLPTINGPGTMTTVQAGANGVTMTLDVPHALPPGQARLDFSIISRSSSIYIASSPSSVPAPITNCLNWGSPPSTSCTGNSGTSHLLPYCLPLKVGLATDETTAPGTSCSSGAGGAPSHGCSELDQLVQHHYLFNEVGTDYRQPTITSESHERIFLMFSAEQGDGRRFENGGDTPFFGIWSYADFLGFANRFQQRSTTIPFYSIDPTVTCEDGTGPCGANRGMPALRPGSTTMPYSNFAIYDLYFACKAWNIAAYPGGYASSNCPADLNHDAVVDGYDLAELLGQWGGACLTGDAACHADLDHDGVVDGEDLAMLLAAWGLPCDE